MSFCAWNLFFNFGFIRFFFRFQLPLRTFWVPYRTIFSIFCLIWQENAFFDVKYSPIFLNLRKSLLKVRFVGENVGHFTKNSSISWRVGTHFEQKFQWKKLFRMIHSIDSQINFWKKNFEETDYCVSFLAYCTRQKQFIQKTLKISVPKWFFQKNPKFFYLMLDFSSTSVINL